ncbi:MAG: hypothetical protein WCD73_20385 [Pseudolabrys sp.]
MLTQISTHQNLSQQPSAENAIAADSGIAMLWLVFYLMALGLAVSSPLILSAIEFAGAAKISTEGSAQRQVLSDALRQNADVIRALGMTGRLSRRNCELILTQQLDQTRVSYARRHNWKGSCPMSRPISTTIGKRARTPGLTTRFA